MFKVQTAANKANNSKAISKEYVTSAPSQYLWDDFTKQVGTYARRSNVAKNTRPRDTAGQAWYNTTTPASAKF